MGRAHLADQMQQEQQRTVRYARQAGAEAAVVALALVFLADVLFDLFPFHAERRIGQHVVEFLVRVAVIGKGVAGFDVGDILAFDQHIGFADGVGLIVEFLAEHRQSRLRIVFFQIFPGDRQHAAGTRCGVVNGTHHAGLGQHVVIFDEQQVDHQFDHFARGEVFSGGFVGNLGKLADQLFKHQPHLAVADFVRVQIDVGETLGHLIQQPGFGEAVDLRVEVEALENVPYRYRKTLNVGKQVFLDVVLVAHQFFHIQRRNIVEALPGLAQQERFGIDTGLLFAGLFGQYGVLGGFQHAVQTAQHSKGQNNLAVFGLFVVAAQ